MLARIVARHKRELCVSHFRCRQQAISMDCARVIGRDRATQLADEARSKTDPAGVTRRVVKNYPLTTHSHPVEYLLQDRAAVENAFSKIETAWLRQRGGEIDLRSATR